MVSVTANDTARAAPARQPWSRILANRLVLTDFLVVVWSVVGTQVARFGGVDPGVVVNRTTNETGLNYTLISVILIVAWMAVLALFQTRDERVIGTGNTEYRRIVDATIRLFGVVAIVAFLLQLNLARSYIIIALPTGLIVLLLSRWIWRQWLAVQRSHGLFSARVMLVGSRASVIAIARDLIRTPQAGYLVVGACIPGDTKDSLLPGTVIPVFSDLDQLHDALEDADADTVVITSSDRLPPARIREISWSLEPGRQHLIMTPGLTDVGGPRIHMRPVAGLPLIHVEMPRYEGRKQFTKRAFDMLGSGILIAIMSIPLIVLACIVKLTSPGPVLYKQERVGLNGEHFNMLKFRSMKVNADAELAALLEAQGRSDKPLFKVKNDPRVTPIGRVLRKYSLDEFPQLFNVFLGSMSLVGPRPQRDGEVALYDNAARRRLLLKPGMSGLWQISGRSTLPWEDAIRLDLYYVENWSLIGDLVILWRTVKAVVAPGDEAH